MKKGWIGFWTGIVFGLLMVVPSFVHADVTISGFTNSTVNLEAVNPSGSDRYATVTGSGSVITSDSAALLTNANGWNVNVNGSLSGSSYGVLFGDDGNDPYYNGTLINQSTIYGDIGAAIMNSGSVTNYNALSAGIGSGIVFYNDGTGTASVTNSGSISGGNDGITFMQPGSGTEALPGTLSVVNTGTIQGSYSGVDFRSFGNGTVNVNNYSGGTITGTAENGIYIYSGGTLDATINNAGTISADNSNWEAVRISGYSDTETYTGTANITNSGTIASGYSGIGINYLDSATVTNNAGGTISSDHVNAIYTYYVNNVTINNSGTIRTYDDEGEYPAIYLGYGDTATLNNYTGGVIQAEYGAGVYAESLDTLNITNAGTIDGGYAGIETWDVGDLDITNSGNITADIRGIEIYGQDGMSATVTNNEGGLIESEAAQPLAFWDVGSVTVNNAGTIRGGQEGILINGSEFGGTKSAIVINEATGVIEGHGGHDFFGSEGVAIYLNSYAYDAELDATVGSATTATVTNAGSITGDNAGVSIFGDDLTTATVTNEATGTIRGFDNGLNIYGAGSATVINAGTIESFTGEDGPPKGGYGGDGGYGGFGYGVNIVDANTATVTNGMVDEETQEITGGTISGGFAGIGIYGLYYNHGLDDIRGTEDDIPGAATVTNYGEITGGMYGVEIFGSVEDTTATVINYAGATIEGGIVNGLNIRDVGTVWVDNYGTIKSGSDGYGGQEGIFISGVESGYLNSVTINNYEDGVIEGHGPSMMSGGCPDGPCGNEGIAVYINDDDDNTVDIANAGSITGGDAGIVIFGNSYTTATVTNEATGLIEGSSGAGLNIFEAGNATVDNAGTITGSGAWGYGGEDGYGSDGYDGFGGHGYGVNISTMTGAVGATVVLPEEFSEMNVANSGTITGTATDGFGGDGSDGGYDQDGYDGGDGYGGFGYGIYIGQGADMPVDSGVTKPIYNEMIAEVTNNESGMIIGTAVDGYGGTGGKGNNDEYVFAKYGGEGGDGLGGFGYGVSIKNSAEATVTNAGEIYGYGGDGYGGAGGDSDDGYGGTGGDGYGGYGIGVGIENTDYAAVTNSGIITGEGGDGYGGDGGYGWGLYYDGGNGGYGEGGDGYGVYIHNTMIASVANTGTITGIGGNGYGGNGGWDGGYGREGYDGYGYTGGGTGVYVENAYAAWVLNGATIDEETGDITPTYEGTISGDFAGVGMQYIYNHAEVLNYGNISGGFAGVYMAYISGSTTAVVNNYGTIQGTGSYSEQMIDGSGSDDWSDNFAFGDLYGEFNGDFSGSYLISNVELDYGIGVGIMFADAAEVYNNEGGTITGGLIGVGIGYVDEADVYNAGMITSTGKGILNADMLSAQVDYFNLDVHTYSDGPFFDIDIDHLGISATGLDAELDYGIGVGILNAGLARVYNYGVIEGGLIGVGIANVDLPILPPTVGYVEETEEAFVYNDGTITSTGEGIVDIATLQGDITYDDTGSDCTDGHCSDSFHLQNVHAEFDYGIGVGILRMETATVVNDTNGIITGSLIGVGIADAQTARVDNAGTITSLGNAVLAVSPDNESYTFNADLDYGIGVGIFSAETADVYNYTAGKIEGGLLGVGIADVSDEVNVYNYGAITAIGNGAVDYTGASSSFSATLDYGIGVGIYGNSITGLLAEIAEPLSYILAFSDNHILDIDTIPDITPTATANVENYGTITGGLIGVGIVDVSTANVENYGTISATGTAEFTFNGNPTIIMEEQGIGRGVLIANAGSTTVTNNVGAVIEGSNTGLAVYGGDATIYNYGTITSTYDFDNDGVIEGDAIYLTDDNNYVTLGSGSATNGNIVVDNAVDEYLNNHIILEGEGTIYASQIQGFNSLTKTGTGTWFMAGDQDFTAYNTLVPIAVNEGVLALSDRNLNSGSGVVASSFTQAEGASLGYVVTASETELAPAGASGALTVNGAANFNNGRIIVIPLAGNYLATTTYDSVLAAGSITNPWTEVVSTSAFLSPTLVEDGTNVYDLVLERLSFTTGAEGSNVGLGADFDQLYEDATGDLRTVLDDLILLSSDDAQRALTEVGGGTHTAFQLMSFNGIGRYLGVLNNHMSGGSGFAFNKQGSGFAWNNGVRLAAAGGGDSMSDAMPMMLAMAGNVGGQSQIASGTNWGIWADGYFSKGNRRSDDAISKYEQNLFGGMLGFDFRVTDNLFMGISAGVSNTDLEFDQLPDEGEMNSYHGSLYLCYDGKPWYALGVLTYAYNDYDLDRYITTLGPTVIANSDYSGKEYVGYAELGYKFNAGGVIIRPLVAFQADYLDQENFEETGAGIYNLAVDDNGTGSYQSFLGVNINGEFKMGASAALKPELRLKWAHEFSNDDHLINAQLVGGGGSFTVEAETLSRDTAIVGAGLTLMFNKNVSAYVQYDAELNSDFINHTGLVGLRLAW